MATIDVISDDFAAGRPGHLKPGLLSDNILTLPMPVAPSPILDTLIKVFGFSDRVVQEHIPLRLIRKVEVVNKEARSSAAAVQRGVAGALIGGIAGAVIGVATANGDSTVTFRAEFEDGRRLLASTDTETFTVLLGAAFQNEAVFSRRANFGAAS
jgi:hypothetical protein